MILLCSGVVMLFTLQNKRLTNFCSPFIYATDSIMEINILTMIVVFIPVVAFSFISIIYFLLIQTLQKHTKQMKGLVKSKVSDIMAQLILDTASNLLAWFPSSIIFTSSLFLSKYPTNLLVWTTSTIVPINSIINPAIFILVTKSNKKTMRLMTQLIKFYKFYYLLYLNKRWLNSQ